MLFPAELDPAVGFAADGFLPLRRGIAPERRAIRKLPLATAALLSQTDRLPGFRYWAYFIVLGVADRRHIVAHRGSGKK
jgi:hypothetical protein